MALILVSLLLPFLVPPDILACCSFSGPYTCLQLGLHGFPAPPSPWIHFPLFKCISQDFFQEGVWERSIYSSWVMGEWACNSRFRVGFPLDQQTLHSLSRAFTMADEKSIIALWLFLCRECAAGQLWGLCVRGFSVERLDGLAFIQLTRGSSFSALYKSGFSAIPSTATVQSLGHWHLAISSRRSSAALPPPSPQLHPLSQTWFSLTSPSAVSICWLAHIRDVTHGISNLLTQPSLWSAHSRGWVQEAGLSQTPCYCWCSLKLKGHCLFVFWLLCLCTFLLNIFSPLCVQCWGWNSGLKQARQASLQSHPCPFTWVLSSTISTLSSFSNLNFPCFSYCLVLPAWSIFCPSKSI